MSDLDRLFALQRAAFARERFPTLAVRKDRLSRLLALVRDNEALFVAAVDRGQFNTVLVNLLLNALDALPHGGRVDIGMHNGDGVELTVEDSGPGIAPAVLPRLFTLFASTKPTGTGLGLSICQRVLQEHGGTITAQNRPEGGARFTLTLPRPQSETAISAA